MLPTVCSKSSEINSIYVYLVCSVACMIFAMQGPCTGKAVYRHEWHDCRNEHFLSLCQALLCVNVKVCSYSTVYLPVTLLVPLQHSVIAGSRVPLY